MIGSLDEFEYMFLQPCLVVWIKVVVVLVVVIVVIVVVVIVVVVVVVFSIWVCIVLWSMPPPDGLEGIHYHGVQSFSRDIVIGFVLHRDEREYQVKRVRVIRVNHGSGGHGLVVVVTKQTANVVGVGVVVVGSENKMCW